MLSIPQAAKRLKITRSRVWRLVKAGRIEATVIEGGLVNEYRISEESLQAFIQTRTKEVSEKEAIEEEVQKAPASEPREEPSDPEV